jgi:hypothetical protein
MFFRRLRDLFRRRRSRRRQRSQAPRAAPGFSLRLEWLEDREVPATVTWQYTDATRDNNGMTPGNWAIIQGTTTETYPQTVNDNIVLSANYNGNITNLPCNLAPAQNNLGSITVQNGYTSTITLGAANTAFAACSILGSCTINLNTEQCNFGSSGPIGAVNGAQVTILGGANMGANGSIQVTNTEQLDLANVLLSCSVSVSAGGTLNFGVVNYTQDPNTSDSFTINGGKAVNDTGAQFLSLPGGSNGFYEPIFVEAGGSLQINSNTSVSSYILASGNNSTVSVGGTNANPSTILSVSKNSSGYGLGVGGGSVLNLADAATISGTVLVNGLMNRTGGPAGSSAVATINGNFYLSGTNQNPAVLNLNIGNLNITNGNMICSYAAVTTFITYGTNILMGNITDSGSVTFSGTNTMTVGVTNPNAAVAFSEPVVSSSGFSGGDFVYTLPPNPQGLTYSEQTVNGDAFIICS